MTSIWFPNNKYPPNTKNYLPCFVLGGGVSIRRKGLLFIGSGEFWSLIMTYEGKVDVITPTNILFTGGANFDPSWR